MAVTDKDGRFSIPNLPAGKWTFQFWHEKLQFLQKVQIDGVAKTWQRGRVEITVDSGQTTDIGTATVRLTDDP
jgi:hypothetical protein